MNPTPALTYLDHNATTPPLPAVIALASEIAAFPGNASAVHKAGRRARQIIEDARATILKQLNAGPRDVLVFTSGATEANNIVLRGTGMERVIVSAIEHPSVLNVAIDKEILRVLPNGIIDLDALEKMLTGNTRQTLISVMLVNNETGVIQPVADVAALARQYGALVHVDAVQALGKMPVDIQTLGADFMTLSAHKAGGLQGTGALVIANCAPVSPLVQGGNQEKNMRAGTENLAGIAGFAKAVASMDSLNTGAQRDLRDRMETRLKSIAPDIVIFGESAPRVGNTSMFALSGASSETQLIALDLAGICVSNGSACSSGTVKASHVLQAMGVAPDLAASSLRISLGWNTTAADIDAFVAAWEKLYHRMQNRAATQN